MQRLGWTVLMALVAGPVSAQTIDGHGIRSGNVRIDATGVHAGDTEVTGAGVRTGRGVGGDRGRRETIVNGNGQARSITCSGGALVVNGNRNDLTVADCASVTVAGNDNVARIAFARPGSLSVPGNRNRLSWQAPRGVRVGVSSLGTRNSIARR